MAKPEPAIYRLILSRLGVEPGSALFIDDQQRNTMVAAGLGMQVIVFTTPQVLRDDFERRGIL
jgi:2-haloacid dehalogenase